ncbi:hypothetical protein AB0F72_06330 [Actinoplanes sp. NPDC023936]|uniref:hypothetical protein n=1 Tax=Actinoplanes sp. NPDC023936 TaxID=3154910 RepID=UPI0033D03C03
MAGLAAILGAGSYLTTTWIVSGDNATETREVTALAPPPEASTPAESPATESPAPSPSKSPAKSDGAATTSPAPLTSEEVRKQVMEARAKAAKDGYEVKRALEPGTDVAAPVGEVAVTNEGDPKKGGTLRTISAKYDLTGQREMLWIAGGVKKVGDAECTQKFRFSNEDEPRVRPTMLMCWRTEKTRSVITIAVRPTGGKPDAEKAVAKLDEQWNKMG